MHTKKLVLLLTLIASLFLFSKAAKAATEIPPVPVNGNVVYDELNWLSPEQEEKINEIVASLDSEGLAQIAVVTLDDCGGDTQKYRNELFRAWGIGHSNDNDGLLILVCWYNGNPELRKIEQETGYGMEGTLPDLLTAKVVEQYFKPAWTAGKEPVKVVADGDAGEALVSMVVAYDQVIRGETPAPLQQQQTAGPSLLFWIVVIVVILLLLIALSSIKSSSGGGGSSTWSTSSSDSGSSSNDSSSFGGGDSGGGGSSSSF